MPVLSLPLTHLASIGKRKIVDSSTATPAYLVDFLAPLEVNSRDVRVVVIERNERAPDLGVCDWTIL